MRDLADLGPQGATVLRDAPPLHTLAPMQQTRREIRDAAIRRRRIAAGGAVALAIAAGGGWALAGSGSSGGAAAPAPVAPNGGSSAGATPQRAVAVQPSQP